MNRSMLLSCCRALKTCLSASLFLFAVAAHAQLQVTTYHNDNLRTGLNPKETILNTANVNPTQFGLLFNLPVDGMVYAQPLYMQNLNVKQNVNVPGQNVHNVVFVATEHNSVYAFDADSNTGSNAAPLWHVNLGPSAHNNGLIGSEIGITATPVIYSIHGSTPALYVVSLVATTVGSVTTYAYKLHVLALTNGAELLNGPFTICGQVPGVGDGSVNGIVSFNPAIQTARSALLVVPTPAKAGTLPGGILYVSFGSREDVGPYHGWVFLYNADTMAQIGIINTGPNALTVSGGPPAGAGVWAGGCGPASDGTSVYFSTGNGRFNPAKQSYGDSILRYPVGSTQVADYFTPFDQLSLDDYDTDLGSGGVMLLPSSASGSGAMSLLVHCGKDGSIHLNNTANLGKYNSSDQIVQELAHSIGGIWGAPAYFNNTIYFGPVYSPLVSFNIKSGNFTSKSPTSYSPTIYKHPGPTPSVSSNGLTSGIVWAIEPNNQTNGPASLQAYDARNLDVLLYDSSATNGRDTMAPGVKFTTPTVINGKVYVGTTGAVSVFGLGAFLPSPTLAPSTGPFTGSVTVTITNPIPGAVIRYTLDGSLPTALSPIYTGPITLTATTTVQARAFIAGKYDSGIISATYILQAGSK